MIVKTLFCSILIVYSLGSTAFTLQTETHTYIVCTEEEVLLVIDRQTGKESLVKVGRSPRSIVIYDQQGFVVNADSNTISVIDLQTHTLVKTISTGKFPFKMVQHGMFAYVLHAESCGVLIINLQAAEFSNLLTDHRLTKQQDIVIEDGKGYICANNCILVLSVDKKVFEKTIEVGSSPYSMVIYGRKGYVLHYLGQAISVIDLDTQTVSSKLNIEGCPKDMALHGSYLYVVCARTHCLVVFDLVVEERVKTISLESDPTTIGINKDLAFVTHSGFRSVSVIDLYAQSCTYFIERNETASLGFSDTHLYLGTKKSKPLSLYENKLFDQPYLGIFGSLMGEGNEAFKKFEEAFLANRYIEAKLYLDRALALSDSKAFSFAAYAFLHNKWGAKDSCKENWFLQFFAYADFHYFEELSSKKVIVH